MLPAPTFTPKQRAPPSLPFHRGGVDPPRGRAILENRSHNRQVGIFPILQSSRKPNLFPSSQPTRPLPPTSFPTLSQPERESDASLGQKASKRVRSASCLIKAPTPKHRRFAPRPSPHPSHVPRRALCAPGGCQAGPGGSRWPWGRRWWPRRKGGGRRSAVPGRGDVAAAELAAAAGVSGARD